MIVISGALVLVALVLLVIGLIDPSLGFVYASIGVSLASFLFLVVGILQRRKEVLPTAETTTAASAPTLTPSPLTDEAVTPISVVKADAAPAVAADGLSGQVLVVAGRPRYHVEGCRYLAGKETDSVEVADARNEGFTACGVCKPDAALVAAPAAVQAPAAVVEPEVVVELEDEVVPTPAAAPVRAARKAAPARKATAPAKAAVTEVLSAPTKPAAAKAPVKAAPVALAKPEAPSAPAKTAAVKAAPAKAAKAAKAAPAAKAAAPAKAAPVKAAPAKAAPVKAAKAAPVKRNGVIVIPDRGKFHTADCRYVRGAEGTLELTKAAASKQGYEACGVCNP